MQKKNADAVLWDYDGTLVNSSAKNIEITKQILAVAAPHLTGNNLPDCLKSQDAYHYVNHQSKNRQDLYINYYGMTNDEMMKAGSMWTEYQLKDSTPVELFKGIKQTVDQLNIPQGICSQNSSENIIRLLKKNNLLYKFKSIIGYDDIPENQQKPSSFSGIKCLEQMFDDLQDKTIYYIGDHEADVKFARNIESDLNTKTRLISVVVTYSGADTSQWDIKPDLKINEPNQLADIFKHAI